jgi:AhpD family alkylhydroperoxidase
MPNPLLTRIQPRDLPDDLASAHEASLALRGDATFFEVFGNHPDLYRWYANSFYGDVFRGGLVERRIKELVRLRLSTQHGCRFCNQGNRVDAMEAGLTANEIDSLENYESGPFSEKDKAALRLADTMRMTDSVGALEPDLYQSLREHFSDAQILELGLVLGVLSGMARFIFTLDLVEREANCPFPHAS